ncbi:MAG: SIMPL domain-containing protein [Pseudomonadota bacterium]
MFDFNGRIVRAKAGCRRWVRHPLASALAFIGALSMAPLAAPAQETLVDTGRIVVSAEGRVTAAPDMATVTLGVRREEETAEGAVDAMSDAAAAVLAAIAEAGIAERDVQTSGLMLSPRYDGSNRQSDTPPRIVGYSAETTLTLRVLELDDLGTVLDAMVGQGSNLFRGLSFGFAEPEPLLDEARRRAVAEARRQAALFAEAAGVTLGPLLRLEAGGAAQQPVMMRAPTSFAEAASVPIAEGEVSLTERVRAVYEIAVP